MVNVDHVIGTEETERQILRFMFSGMFLQGVAFIGDTCT